MMRVINTRTKCPPASGQRASVLVIVIITLLFATFALFAFIEKASNDLLVEARETTGRRLRQEAYSALEVTLAVLEDFRQFNGGLRSPAEGWAEPLKFTGWAPREGVTVGITFEDESGKLSIPHVDAATFLNVFKNWGLSQPDAERLADVLLVWMRKDYVPTTTQSPDYEQGALPYAPPLRALRSYGELAAIDYAREVFYDEKGQPNELWQRFVDTFSLFDFKQTNINSGRSDVLAGLGSYEMSQQQKLLEYLQGTGAYARSGPGYFQATSDAASLLGTNVLPSGFGSTIMALRIYITITEGRSVFRLSAVIAPPNGATTVQTTATSSRLKTSDSTSSTTVTAVRTSSPSATTDTQKKLNYPFTLLEIRENAAIPPSYVPKPAA